MNNFDERGNLLPNPHTVEFQDALDALAFWAATESDARCLESNLKAWIGQAVLNRIGELHMKENK